MADGNGKSDRKNFDANGDFAKGNTIGIPFKKGCKPGPGAPKRTKLNEAIQIALEEMSGQTITIDGKTIKLTHLQKIIRDMIFKAGIADRPDYVKELFDRAFGKASTAEQPESDTVYVRQGERPPVRKKGDKA